MMAGYRFNKEEYFKETKEVYSNYPTDVSRMEERLAVTLTADYTNGSQHAERNMQCYNNR